MRKIITLLVAVIPLIADAQEKKKERLKIDDLTLGVMLTGGVSMEKDMEQEKGSYVLFPTFLTVSPSIGLSTQKTHHSLMFELRNKGLQTLNGYFISDKMDLYCFFEKSVTSPDKYLSLGLEHVTLPRRAQWLELVFFAEIGTDFHQIIPSLGITIHPQVSLFH